MTQLVATGIPMRTQWFMQDVERLLTAKVALDFFHQTPGEAVTSGCLAQHHDCGHTWPPLGHHIIPCEFLTWGFLNAK
jgi:hypothetical protein